MPKVARLLAATSLAFGSLLFTSPARADWVGTNANVTNGAVQFDFRGGSATQSITATSDGTLTLTVNNTIANKIGWNGQVADTWSVSINGQVFSGNEIGTSTITVPITAGTTTLIVSGIDNGFWAGWYGPIISAPVISYPAPIIAPAPAPSPIPNLEPSPAPTTDSVRDVSDSVRQDPATESVRPVVPPVEPTPAPSPAPSPEPAPAPEPASPAPEPTPAEPMPLPEQTAPPAEPEAPAEPAIPEATTEPIPQLEIAPAPKPELPELQDKVEPAKSLDIPSQPNVADLDPSKINPETLTVAQAAELTQAAFETLSTAEPGSPEYETALEQLMVVAESDDPELPAELANIPLIGGVATAVLDAFNNIGNIGADMSPKQRKQAKKEVLVSIAVGQAIMSAGLIGSIGYRKGV